MNKLDAISMPDNGCNCPIKTRDDVATPRKRNNVRKRALTDVAIKCPPLRLLPNTCLIRFLDALDFTVHNFTIYPKFGEIKLTCSVISTS